MVKIREFIDTFAVAVYAIAMTFVEDAKSFTIQKEISYPVDRVFPQFNNLQNFTRWNAFFSEDPDFTFDYFTPYEGQGSSMSYHDKKIRINSEISSSVTKIRTERFVTSFLKAKKYSILN
ncbi:hypothetical protein LDL59_06630 [Kaistella anthropi]|nr:hypothetical protein [Kaistella anthropi]